MVRVVSRIAGLGLFGLVVSCVAPRTPGPKASGEKSVARASATIAPPAVQGGAPATDEAGLPDDSVHGRVSDEAGRALSLAHARLFDFSYQLIAVTQVAPDGRFVLPRVTDPDTPVWLELTAVDRRQTKILIATQASPVELRVRLGTYAQAPAPGALFVVSGSRGSGRSRVPMTLQADGTYVADVTATDGALRYELDGVALGRNVNGTMGDRYEYDNGGDYFSVVPASSGQVHVVFDPTKRPPAGIDTKVEFADRRSTSAQLAEISGTLDAVLEQLQQYAIKAKASGQAPGPPGVEVFEPLKRLAELTASSDPLVRRAALVASFAYGPTGDQSTAAKALAEIPANDAIWGLQDCAFASALERAGGEQQNAEYVAAFTTTQARPGPVGCYLLRRLQKPGLDPAKARELVSTLRSQRFANTMYPSLAIRHDPDRLASAGKPLPAFDVPALDGKRSWSPSSLKGKLYLIDIWATWCQPCVAGMPALHAAYAKYGKARKRPLHVLSISVDESAETVARFRKGKNPMPWEHALAKGNEKRALLSTFGDGIPFYALVDEAGKILACSPDLSAEKLGAVLEGMAGAGHL